MPDLLLSAIEPYRNSATLGDGFLEQFQRICGVAEWLASSEPTERSLSNTLSVFENLVKSESRATLAAEFEINRIQIVRYADRFGFESFYDEQAKLERWIAAHDALLEAMHDYPDQSNTSTFFLSEMSDDCFLEADEYLRQIDGTKRLLEDVLSSISRRAKKDQPRRLGGAIASLSRFGHGLFSRSNFEALASIHHEIAENALSHGTYSRLNQRSLPNTNPAFGNCFHLQVRSLPLTKINQNKIQELHPNFEEHAKALLENADSKPTTCWIFSFCDTGGGILNHVENFSPSSDMETNDISIKKLISEKLSTRNFSGSGYGLDKICKFTKQLGAFAFIETKGSSFSYDGVRDVMLEAAGRVQRGTMISIVISSRIQDAVSDR